MVPALLLYAGFTLRTLLANTRRPARLASLVLALVAIFFLVNTSSNLRFDPDMLAHSQGYKLESLGRESEALARYEEAVRLNPGLVLSRLFAARIYAEHGEVEKARTHYLALLRLAPHNAALAEEVRQFLASTRK